MQLLINLLRERSPRPLGEQKHFENAFSITRGRGVERGREGGGGGEAVAKRGTRAEKRLKTEERQSGWKQKKRVGDAGRIRRSSSPSTPI